MAQSVPVLSARPPGRSPEAQRAQALQLANMWARNSRSVAKRRAYTSPTPSAAMATSWASVRLRQAFRPTYSTFNSINRRTSDAMTFRRSTAAHLVAVSSSTGGEGRIRTTRRWARSSWCSMCRSSIARKRLACLSETDCTHASTSTAVTMSPFSMSGSLDCLRAPIRQESYGADEAGMNSPASGCLSVMGFPVVGGELSRAPKKATNDKSTNRSKLYRTRAFAAFGGERPISHIAARGWL